MFVRIVTPCCSPKRQQGDGAHPGRHLDLKAHPERTSELPEAQEWRNLGNFVEAINRCSAFRTCGCNASTSRNEVPFVDIAFDEPELWTSSEVCRKLSDQLRRLDGTDTAGSFTVELSVISANLPNRTRINGLRLWLLGARSDAVDAFCAVHAMLAQQDPKDYLPVAKHERALAAKERRQSNLAFALFLLTWLTFCCVCAGLVGASNLVGWRASGDSSAALLSS